MIKKTHFNNPNSLESNLQIYSNFFNKMFFFETSKLVGSPVNLVNDYNKNRNGLTYSYDIEEMNIMFNNGKRINYHQLSFHNIDGPHKEIEYIFI